MIGSKKKNVRFVSLVSLFSICLTTAVYHYAVPQNQIYTLENVVYLSLVLCCIISLFRIEHKNHLDIILLVALIFYYIEGPLKYIFLNFFVYYISTLVFYTLLLSFIWFFLKEFVTISNMLLFFGIGFQFLIRSATILYLYIVPYEYYFIKTADGESIRIDMITHFVYELILSLSAIIPILYIIGSVFIRNRSFSGIKMRNILELLGIFLFFLYSLMNSLFVFEGQLSPWLHELLELVGIPALLILFIAFRLSDTHDKEEFKHMLAGIQFALVFPIIYTFFFFGDHRSFFASLGILCFVELIFFLFYSLMTVRNRMIQQGNLLYEMADYLMSFWNRTEDDLFITDANGEIITAGHGMGRLQSMDIQGRNIRDILRLAQPGGGPTSGTTQNREDQAWLTSNEGLEQPVDYFQKKLTASSDSLSLNIIRDRRRYQEIMRLHQDMQNKLLELKKIESLLNFSGDISHHMNNFLSGIRGYCELMRLDYNNPDTVVTYTEKIIDQVTRTAAYIQKISDLTKPVPREMEPVALSDVCRQAIDQITNVLDQNNVTADCRLPDDLPSVPGIHHDLVDVFHHLLWNAAEAMPQGGAITISANRFITTDEVIDPRGLTKQEYVTITVRDTGSGIADEHRDYIFDPFFSTRSKVGKGLGLTIVMAIVKYHQGTVSFSNNKPDPGTTFTITLPTSIITNKYQAPKTK